MSNAVPSVLVDYIEQGLSKSSLSLITSILNAPANWLTLRYIYSAFFGFDNDHHSRPQQHIETDGHIKVIFLSFVRPLKLWIDLGKKLRLDLTSLILKKKLFYIDGLTYDIAESAPIELPIAKLRSLKLNDISNAITEAIQSSSESKLTDHGSPTSTSISNTVIVIDSLDFILASQLDTDALKMQEFISSLRANPQIKSVILSCQADGPLLHNQYNNSTTTPLEREHAAFLTMIAHQSQRVMQLRGLATGSAKDVTGVLRVSKGGDSDSDESERRSLQDGEWLYHVKGDGSLKVWSRGE